MSQQTDILERVRLRNEQKTNDDVTKRESLDESTESNSDLESALNDQRAPPVPRTRAEFKTDGQDEKRISLRTAEQSASKIPEDENRQDMKKPYAELTTSALEAEGLVEKAYANDSNVKELVLRQLINEMVSTKEVANREDESTDKHEVNEEKSVQKSVPSEEPIEKPVMQDQFIEKGVSNEAETIPDAGTNDQNSIDIKESVSSLEVETHKENSQDKPMLIPTPKPRHNLGVEEEVKPKPRARNKENLLKVETEPAAQAPQEQTTNTKKHDEGNDPSVENLDAKDGGADRPGKGTKRLINNLG